MKLKDAFAAEKFDADFITDIALEGGMKYVNITSRHHDGFSLFETAQNDYHAQASPAKRDLIAEYVSSRVCRWDDDEIDVMMTLPGPYEWQSRDLSQCESVHSSSGLHPRLTIC
jgi:hypothetical protein